MKNRKRIFARYRRQDFWDELKKSFVDELNCFERDYKKSILDDLEKAIWQEHDLYMEYRKRIEKGEFRMSGISGILN